VQIPIPDDWDGLSWQCVQIEWPNSPQWLALLYGFLSQATRGRFWDEGTGSILNTQAIGWQIWDRNIPLADCAGDVIPVDGGLGGDGIGISTGGGIVIMEEEDMGQVVTEIKIVDGKLRVYYGHCCYDELDMPSVADAAQTGEIGDDPLNPSGDPNYVYSACGKANAIVAMVYSIVEAFFSAATEPLPWKWVPYVETTVGYDLDNQYVVSGVLVAAAGIALGKSYAEVYDAVEYQNIVSKMVAFFADDATGVPTDADFESIKGLFRSEFGLFEDEWGLFDDAINALGRYDMDQVAKLGAGTTTADCDAPILWPTIPADHTWEHHYDFSRGEYGWTDIGNFYAPFVGYINPDVAQFEQLPGISKAAIGGPGSVVYIAALVDVWPTGTLGGGAAPFWFEIGSNFWDPALRGSLYWIGTAQVFAYIVGTLFKVFNMQFDQAGVSGVSKWHRLVIAGTGTDPFPSDPV